MIEQLTSLANHLDTKGLSKEADYLDAVIRKVAECKKDSPPWSSDMVEPPWTSNTVMVRAPGDCVTVSTCGQAGKENEIPLQHSEDGSSPGLSVRSKQTFKFGGKEVEGMANTIDGRMFVEHIRLEGATSVSITPSVDEQDFFFCGVAMEAR